MNNKNSPDWWSDRRFWNDFAPLMFDSERWGNAVGDVEGMIKLTGSVPPEKILDVGCGPGRHSLELGKKGFRATGIDINENYLETAEKLSRSGQLEIPPVFLNCDMRGINTTESFNGAISFFQSLGYFENPDEDLKVCTEVYKALEKDGWFLVDMDGVKIRNKVRVKEVAKDLGRLKAAFWGIISQSDHEFFLDVYRRGNRFFQHQEKKVLAKVRKLTRKKLQQKQNL